MEWRVLVLFIFGLFIGSFLNVLIWRLPRREKWIRGRSRCVHCKHGLAWYDLIPLLSFVWLMGKCRYCKRPIAMLYPIVEMANGLLWGLAGWLLVSGYQLSGIGQLGWEGMGLIRLILLLILFSTLLVIFVVDLQHYIIPDEMVVAMGAIGLVLGISSLVWPHLGGGLASTSEVFGGVEGPLSRGELVPGIVERVVWGMGAMGFFWLLHMITKGKGMGWGDVKLVLGMGLVLAQATIVALMSAFIIGAVMGVGLLLAGKRTLKQPIPFGPFLVVGMVVGLLYGRQVLEWYLIGLGY